MIFDIEQQSEGDWFTFFESRINERGEVIYDDPKPEAGRVRIRSIAPIIEANQAKRKRKFEWVLNTATREMQRGGYYEELTPEQAQQERNDVWNHAITGIENFKDKRGIVIACTPENKVKLMAVPVFDRFVARCLQLLSGAGVKEKEEQEKNA